MKNLIQYEPVAIRLYPVLGLIIGYLITRGLVDGDIANLCLAVAAAVLGIPAIHTARAKVTPISKLGD